MWPSRGTTSARTVTGAAWCAALCAALVSGVAETSAGQGAAPVVAPVRVARLAGDTLGLDTPAFRDATSRPWWQYLATQRCEAERGVSADEALQRRVGALPLARAGVALRATPVAEGARYRVSLETVSGRLPGTEVVGWLLTPIGSAQGARAALVVHGAGASFETALGWRLPGGNPDGYARTPLTGVAAELALRGWTVFVPWVSDDHSFWPLLPWLELDNYAAAWRARGGPASAYGLVVPQLQAALDFVQRQSGDSTSRVLVAGWEEGAALGRVLAAVDARVGGLLVLGPVVDRAAYRHTAAGVRENAPFTHFDCTFDDAAAARRLAPRPLAHVIEAHDPTLSRYAAMSGTRALASVRAAYVRAGGDAAHVLVVGAGEPADTTRRALARALQWMAQQFGATIDDTRMAVTASDWVPQPPNDRFPADRIAGARLALSHFVSARPSCTVPRDVLGVSRESFAREATRAQRALVQQLGVRDAGPRRTDAAVRIVHRDTLVVRQNTVVEWIVAESSRSALPLVGLLGTPRDAGLRDAAGVLSFDGNFGLSPLFGLPPLGATPYLGEYATILARDGDVVFAPLMPDWMPRGATALLRARDGDAASAWPLMLDHYAAGIDLLRALPTVDRARIGAYGISFAGYAALLTTALDARVSGLVYSNPAAVLPLYFQTDASATSSVWLSELCAVSDDAMRYLIAPRPLVFETDASDTGANQRYDGQQVAELRHIFDALGIGDRLTTVRHDGGHETRVFGLLSYLPWRRR